VRFNLEINYNKLEHDRNYSCKKTQMRFVKGNSNNNLHEIKGACGDSAFDGGGEDFDISSQEYK
jgi:hypothetical protein